MDAKNDGLGGRGSHVVSPRVCALRSPFERVHGGQRGAGCGQGDAGHASSDARGACPGRVSHPDPESLVRDNELWRGGQGRSAARPAAWFGLGSFEQETSGSVSWLLDSDDESRVSGSLFIRLPAGHAQRRAGAQRAPVVEFALPGACSARGWTCKSARGTLRVSVNAACIGDVSGQGGSSPKTSEPHGLGAEALSMPERLRQRSSEAMDLGDGFVPV